jgi:hypothetical protein
MVIRPGSRALRVGLIVGAVFFRASANVTTVTVDEKTSGNQQAYAASVSSTDLINNGQTTVSSVTATDYTAFQDAQHPGAPDYVLSDGSHGGDTTSVTNVGSAFTGTNQFTVIYNLNTALNPGGYSLTAIDIFTAHLDNRAGIGCSVYVSSVSSPSTFTLVGVVDSATPGGTNQAHHVKLAGSSHPTPFFTNAAAVKFSLEVGTGGNPNVWRELDVAGYVSRERYHRR